jgi:hypothetical protein
MSKTSHWGPHLKTANNSWGGIYPVMALALLCASGFSYVFFPGFMSFDSLQQFRQVSGFVELSDAHPVVMVYLWRMLLAIYNHAGILLIFYQLLYWCTIALFSYLVARRLAVQLVLLISIGLCPPLIIMSLHLWKDVGMMCALAISVVALLGYTRYAHFSWLILSVLALFFAVAVRINGFIPALPLIFLTCYLGAKILRKGRLQTIGLTATGIFSIYLIFIISMNIVNSNARKSYGIGTLIVWDIVSISLAENEDLLPKYLHRIKSDNIISDLSVANSTEANYPSFSVISAYPPESFQRELIKDWFELILLHPGAYLRHRTHVMSVLLGLSNKDIYYPYHPGIDENEFGIRFENINNEDLRRYFNLFDKFSSSFIYRPWIYASLALIVFIVSCVRIFKRRGSSQANLLASMVAFSGLASAGSLLIIATAADYRYISWTILAAIMAAVLLSNDIYQSIKSRRASSIIEKYVW